MKKKTSYGFIPDELKQLALALGMVGLAFLAIILLGERINGCI